MTESSPSDAIFKKRLREVRELRGYNQAELGAKAGLQPAAVSHFETGARKPSFDNLRRLATALAISTDYLLGRVETMEESATIDVAFRDYQNLSDLGRKVVQGVIEQMKIQTAPSDAVLAKRSPSNEGTRGRKRT